MTILEPNKGQQLNKILIWSVLLLIGVASWSIFSYNKMVTFSRTIRETQIAYKAASARNADLKNERFSVVDGKLLKNIALERGLVKVKKPTYVNVTKEHALAAAHE